MPLFLHHVWGLILSALATDAAAVRSYPARDKIVYIKTHCTGSSTLTNVLHRYCDNYGRECYVPPVAGKMCTEPCLENIAGRVGEAHTRFDVWPNHVVYVPSLLEAIVPGGVAISVFREPFDRVMSAYAHGHVPAMQHTLDALRRNETVTNCGMSGIRMSKQVPLKYLAKLDFVILTEEYNLGLVLMRRFLGWKLKDIVYIRLKSHTTTQVDPVAPLRKYLSRDDEELTGAARAFKDYCMGGDEAELYRRATDKFWRQYTGLGSLEKEEVDTEVKDFAVVLQRVHECCEADPKDSYCKAMATDNEEWVQQQHQKSFGGFWRKLGAFLGKPRSGCLSLVPVA